MPIRASAASRLVYPQMLLAREITNLVHNFYKMMCYQSPKNNRDICLICFLNPPISFIIKSVCKCHVVKFLLPLAFSNNNCVGQFCPVFKLCGRRPGPILSSFVQREQERARPNIQCEGKRISEDSRQMNGQNYLPRKGEACL